MTFSVNAAQKGFSAWLFTCILQELCSINLPVTAAG